MLQDVAIEFRRRVVLRIAAEDFLLLARSIRQIDKVADDIDQSRLVKQPLNHRVERIDSVLFDEVAAVRLAPGVEKLVGCEKRTRLVVHPVADHAEGVVLKEFGNVALVTGGELYKGIVNRRFFANRALEFKHYQGQSVDVEDAIRDAFLVAENIQLIDDLENVSAAAIDCLVLRHDRRHLASLRLPKRHQLRVIEQLDIQILLAAVFSLQEKAI